MIHRSLSLFLILLFLTSCSSIQKMRAGKILSQCKFSITGWSFASAEIDSALFPKAADSRQNPFPNPHIMNLAKDLLQGKTSAKLGVAWINSTLNVENLGKDSIQISKLAGMVRLDTLIQATWHSDATVWIAPGKNQIPIEVRLPMDSRLFQIMQADSLYLEGSAHAALELDQTPIILEFAQTRPNPKEEIKIFANNAKKEILDALLNGWARSIM